MLETIFFMLPLLKKLKNIASWKSCWEEQELCTTTKYFFQIFKAGSAFEKSVNTIHHSNRLEEKITAITIEREQAFDRIQYPSVIKLPL